MNATAPKGAPRWPQLPACFLTNTGLSKTRASIAKNVIGHMDEKIILQ